MDYIVKNNTPEELKQLAKDGWYPCGKQMGMRAISIKIPKKYVKKLKKYWPNSTMYTMPVTIFPVIVSGGDTSREPVIYDKKYMQLVLHHRSFKPVKEGQTIPCIGTVIEE